MANQKISQLTDATTPLAGTEVLPIVQSGTTVKVANNDLRPKQIQSNATSGVIQIVGPAAAATRVMTVPDANFTAARTDAAQSFIGDQTLSTGNIIQGTAAKGVNFTANTFAAGMTSQLLNWYEEGTFTPVIQGATSTGTGTYTNQIGRYTRIGRAVHFTIYLIWTAHTGTGVMLVAGLPFTSNSTVGQYYQYAAASDSLTYGVGTTLQVLLFNNQTIMTCYSQSSGAALSPLAIDTQADLVVTGTYFV